MLKVKALSIDIVGSDGVTARVVDDISFELAQGETLGVVGESGSGKTMLALAIMRLLPAIAKPSGEIWLGGDNLLTLSEPAMCGIRGGRIGMIFQEPMTALNPAQRVGTQIAEGLVLHSSISQREARRRAIELLERVRIPEAARRIDSYPHELSGGQRQRVGIAIALALKPQLLIADEPTTALDVTVQKEILDILDDLVTDMGMSLIFISHDIGVIGRIADRTLVMFGGKQMEQGPTMQVLRAPAADYTRSLLAAMPRRTRGSLVRGSLAAGMQEILP
jgi:peptide/nickel transport system ATP-binding protein